jgi:hypothetical protein
VKTKYSSLPVCACGSREFEAIFRGRNPLGRTEFRLACRRCRAHQLVDKTTFALFRYLGQRTPSRRFLKLFDLT